MMMATAVVTVGVVAAGSAPMHLRTGHAYTVAMSERHAKTGHAATTAHRHTSAGRSPAVTVRRPVTHVATTATSGPGTTANVDHGPLSAHANLAKDPTKPGTVQDHDVVVHTPVGDYRLRGDGVLGPGSDAACPNVGTAC
jgi:hypothetical protein